MIIINNKNRFRECCIQVYYTYCTALSSVPSLLTLFINVFLCVHSVYRYLFARLPASPNRQLFRNRKGEIYDFLKCFLQFFGRRRRRRRFFLLSSSGGFYFLTSGRSSAGICTKSSFEHIFIAFAFNISNDSS